jgi:glycosyltransferase involved in cell wall biosynthesis
MKVVAQNAARVWGGNEKWLGVLGAGLSRRGHDVLVSCRTGDVRDRYERLGLRTTAIRPRGEGDIFSALQFSRWLNRERPDAVLLTSWVPSVLGAWAARAANIPRVVVRQGIVREFPRSPIRARAYRRWIDMMIVNSPEIREAWLAGGNGYPADRVRVILNGVASRRAEREELRRRLREELGVQPETILIGGAGHLFTRKGFDILLRGFSVADVPDSRLAILGEGDHADALRSLGRELGIADRIDWLGGRSNGPDIIGGYDVFVLSSRNEGMANVMLEAMAAGAPVIAADVSGVRTALAATTDRPAGGWLYAPDDVDALSTAIRNVVGSLRSDDRLVRQRVDEAHWRIENWFSIDRMIDECEAVLFGPAPSHAVV